jgi:transposase
MSRRQRDPLRPLSDAERLSLSRLSRSQSAPAAQVARARALPAVADGQSCTMAADLVGRATGDAVARWVAAFNRDGLIAVKPRHGGGRPVRHGEAEQRRIPAEVARVPERARDGTATRSPTMPRDALRRAEDGLPGIGTYTIGRALHAAGYSRQKGRSRCGTGVVVRRRKHEGLVIVADPDAAARRGRSSGPARSATLSAWRSGARTRPVRSRPCRSRAAAGGRKATQRSGRTSMSGVAPARF